MKYHAILVLSDGETWETVAGQSICIITDDQFQDLCEDRIPACRLTPVFEIGIQDFTPYNNDVSGEKSPSL
jgi:hypothetical protein